MNVFDLYHNLVDIRWGKNKESLCTKASGPDAKVGMKKFAIKITLQ